MGNGDENLTEAEVADCRRWLNSIAGKYARKILFVYQTLEWKWMNGVPDLEEIEATLSQLAHNLHCGGTRSAVSTGGLTAWIEKNSGSVSCGFRLSLEANRYGTGNSASCAKEYRTDTPEDPPPDARKTRGIIL